MKLATFPKTIVLVAAAAALYAQTPPPNPQTSPAVTPAVTPPGRGGRGGGGGGGAYPQRAAADPAVLDRGKALYGVHCNFCHGSDARGGEGGPNLLRADLVLNDKNGELIAPVVQNGKGEMPKLNLNDAQVSDIATYIHSFRVGGYDISRMVPPSILVGDASAGEATYKTKCGACHSVTGDLKGIATRIPDAKLLQNGFLMPGGGGRGGGRGGRGASPFNVPPTTVTVTPAAGPKVEGRLVRVDDFLVILMDSEGGQRSFRRDGEVPKVEIHDPLQPHKALLPTYTDKQIHDLTAYLVTLK